MDTLSELLKKLAEGKKAGDSAWDKYWSAKEEVIHEITSHLFGEDSFLLKPVNSLPAKQMNLKYALNSIIEDTVHEHAKSNDISGLIGKLESSLKENPELYDLTSANKFSSIANNMSISRKFSDMVGKFSDNNNIVRDRMNLRDEIAKLIKPESGFMIFGLENDGEGNQFLKFSKLHKGVAQRLDIPLDQFTPEGLRQFQNHPALQGGVWEKLHQAASEVNIPEAFGLERAAAGTLHSSTSHSPDTHSTHEELTQSPTHERPVNAHEHASSYQLGEYEEIELNPIGSYQYDASNPASPQSVQSATLEPEFVASAGAATPMKEMTGKELAAMLKDLSAKSYAHDVADQTETFLASKIHDQVASLFDKKIFKGKYAEHNKRIVDYVVSEFTDNADWADVRGELKYLKMPDGSGIPMVQIPSESPTLLGHFISAKTSTKLLHDEMTAADKALRQALGAGRVIISDNVLRIVLEDMGYIDIRTNHLTSKGLNKYDALDNDIGERLRRAVEAEPNLAEQLKTPKVVFGKGNETTKAIMAEVKAEKAATRRSWGEYLATWMPGKKTKIDPHTQQAAEELHSLFSQVRSAQYNSEMAKQSLKLLEEAYDEKLVQTLEKKFGLHMDTLPEDIRGSINYIIQQAENDPEHINNYIKRADNWLEPIKTAQGKTIKATDILEEAHKVVRESLPHYETLHTELNEALLQEQRLMGRIGELLGINVKHYDLHEGGLFFRSHEHGDTALHIGAEHFTPEQIKLHFNNPLLTESGKANLAYAVEHHDFAPHFQPKSNAEEIAQAARARVGELIPSSQTLTETPQATLSLIDRVVKSFSHASTVAKTLKGAGTVAGVGLMVDGTTKALSRDPDQPWTKRAFHGAEAIAGASLTGVSLIAGKTR